MVDLDIKSNFVGLLDKGSIYRMYHGWASVIAIILSVIIGIFTGGLGGLAFYVTWAAIDTTIVKSHERGHINRAREKRKKATLAYLARLANMAGRFVNTRQSRDPVRVIYGQVKVGGVWAFNKVSRSNNKMLNTVVTWSEGEIEGLATGIDDSPIFNGGAAYTTLNDLRLFGEFSSVCTCYLSAHGFSGCSTCDVACHVYTP